MSIATEIARLQQAKADLKTAINAKGRAITDETIDLYAAEVDLIETGGVDISDADAAVGDVLEGKTFYSVSGGRKTGTLVVGVNTPPATWDFTVEFIDYDGTVLSYQWIVSGEDAVAPRTPTHAGLTFDSWNVAFTNVTRNLVVNPVYDTSDGKTHLFITLNPVTTKNFLIYLNKSDGSTLTIDWGDGSANFTSTGTGNINTSHTYTNYGDYEITIWISLGTGSYSFGNGTYTTSLAGNTSSITNGSVQKLFVGANVVKLAYYGLNNYSLRFITLPNEVVSIEDYAISGARLVSLIVPNAISSFGMIRDCGKLKFINLGSSITVIKAYQFTNLYELERIIVPATVINIETYAFYNCRNLEEIVLEKTGSITTLGDTSAFINIPAICKIYVPDALVSTYKAATNWVTYANYIYPISSM